MSHICFNTVWHPHVKWAPVDSQKMHFWTRVCLNTSWTPSKMGYRSLQNTLFYPGRSRFELLSEPVHTENTRCRCRTVKDRKPDLFLWNREAMLAAVRVWIATIHTSSLSSTLTDGDKMFQAHCSARVVWYRQASKLLCKFSKMQTADPALQCPGGTRQGEILPLK